MLVIEYLLRCICYLAIAIGLSALLAMALYGVLKGFGYFKRIPPFHGEQVTGDER